MQTTLIIIGFVCIMAGITGGGLKAFEIEMPIIGSIKRQALLGLFGVGLLVW